MLTYDLDRRSGIPKYEYLYRRIRRDVRSGVIPAGTRMPSKRALAAHLSVSVGTVEHAYDLLTSEGYLRARPGSGFYAELPGGTAAPVGVAAGVAGAAVGASGALSSGAQSSAGASSSSAPKSDAAPVGDPVDLRANRCSMDLFPADTWSRIMRRVLSDRDPALLDTVPFNGLAELREAIADYLYEFRGMRPRPDNIVVGAGTEYLYGRLLQLLGPSSVVAMGDPGYKRLAQVSRSIGTLWEYVPVDEQGMVVDRVASGPARVVHVSPANHFPMGAVMSPARRDQLLAWVAEDPTRYVVEDDYDSEIRFSGRGLPPLAAVDRTDSVVYLNTFSKTLVPSIRISYMVLPDALMDLYRRQLSFYSCTVSSFEQLALAQFVSGGYFERHVSRLRRFYDARRREVLHALAASPLSLVARAVPVEVGTHLRLQVKTTMSDEQVVGRAGERGLHIAMLTDYCAVPTASRAHTVVLNFASIAPGRVDEAVGLLAEVFSDDISRASR